MNLSRAYDHLVAQFGPQGWWPVYRMQSTEGRMQNGEAVLTRGTCPKRLTDAQRFQICVGAILTQHTAWTNVERAFVNLLAARVCDVRVISRMQRSRLATLIRPAGYFHQKARTLQEFSRWLLREYGGSLAQFFRQPTATCRAELLAQWGIGPETADSTLLYAGGHAVFVIDAYTKRWLARQGIVRRTYDEYQRFFMDRLTPDAARFNEFHALLVAWGKMQRA